MFVFQLNVKRLFPAIFVSLFLLLNFSAALAQDETAQTDDPVKLFNQGQDAHEKGDLQTAINLYRQALKITPEFPEAEYQLGAALVSAGKTVEAEKAFRHAIELRENWVLPMTSLGNLLILQNKFSEAEAVLNKALALDKQEPTALVALTELLVRAKAAPEALKSLLEKIVNAYAQKQPPAAIWAAKGALENALGDKVQARKSLNNALAVDSKNSFALSTRSDISLAEKNFPDAIEDAKMLVKISPNSTSAKIRLAQIYATSGNIAEALNILNDLDASNPDVAALKNSISTNSTEDVSALEKTLEKEPQNVNILGRLCNLTRVSNPQKSLDYCRRASQIEPNNLNHAIGFGAALVQAKQFEPAIQLFQKLLPLEKDNYVIHANLATALFGAKRFAEAKTEYTWLTTSKPDAAIAFYFLAISHDQLAEYVEALESYQTFLRLADPKQNQLEIDKVNLRLPVLEKLVKQKGRKQ